MSINLFSIAGFTLAFTTFFLTLVLLMYGKAKIHTIWGFFNLIVGLWGVGAFYIGQIKDPSEALVIWRVVHVAIIFIPILNYHVVHILCGLKSKKILKVIYVQGILFSLFSLFSPLFIPSVRLVFNSFYYDVAGPVFYLFFTIWSLIVGYSHYLLFIVFLNSKGRLRNQILYFFLGTALGFSGGITNFLPALGVDFYPIGNFTIPIYCLVVSYAILKHRLLDITVAVTRTGIFVAVYSLVLGIPFAMAFVGRDWLFTLFGSNWWVVPLTTSTVLATVGPFVYLYIQKRTEDRLFQEQRRYQTTLRQASYGMGRIKDLKRLVNLIVHIVNRTVGLEHSIVYLHDLKQKRYFVGAYRSRVIRFNPQEFVTYESPLIENLKKNKDPILYDEIKQRTQDFGDRNLAKLEHELGELKAALVVPSFIDENLLAFIVLGEKTSKKPYVEDDLSVFSILANQAALAIENAQFYEDMKKTHAQLLRAEKMATIGTMADGLSHQINNRLHALGFIAGDALDTIKLKKKDTMAEDVKELVIDIEHALSRIQDNVEQGGEIVQGLLKYTRKGEEGFAPVDLDKLISAAMEMTQFKIRQGDLVIQREFGDVPKIKGNFTQLQEVFFNIIDNAYDAMMQRKQELNEEGFHPTLKIYAKNGNGKVYIEFLDNGIGIKDEDQEKLFTPFFTTKLSSKKGTGLGLYVIQRIIEENHGGKVSYESKYQEGTKTKVELKAY